MQHIACLGRVCSGWPNRSQGSSLKNRANITLPANGVKGPACGRTASKGKQWAYNVNSPAKKKKKNPVKVWTGVFLSVNVVVALSPMCLLATCICVFDGRGQPMWSRCIPIKKKATKRWGEMPRNQWEEGPPPKKKHLDWSPMCVMRDFNLRLCIQMQHKHKHMQHKHDLSNRGHFFWAEAAIFFSAVRLLLLFWLFCAFYPT